MASHEPELKDDQDQDIEYDSDSDEGTSALALRRRVASDDEEDDREENIGGRTNYYDDGVENQEGAPPAEDHEDVEEEEEEEYEEYEEDGEEYEEAEDDAGLDPGRNEEQGDADGGKDPSRIPQGGPAHAARGSKEGPFEEKKDAEPFVVPTAGAFYMHDDRFRYNGVARPRRSAGGRRLWEAKDEKPWVHDRFEELKLSEESYYEQGGRGRRGRGRQGRGYGRGKNPGWGRGRGGKEKASEEPVWPSHRVRGRGRGLRRARMDDYEFKESRSAGNRYTSSSSHPSSGQSQNLTVTSAQKTTASQPMINTQEATLKKPTISSMLNISSPPFFPTRTMSQPMAGLVASTNKVSGEKSGERDVLHAGKVVNASRGMEKEMTGFSSTSVTRQSSSSRMTPLPLVNNTDTENGLHRNLARGSNPSQPQQSIAVSGQQRIVKGERSSNHMVEQPLLSSAPQPSKRATPASPSLHAQQLSSALQQPVKGVPLPTQSSMRMQQPHQQVQATIPGQIPSGQPVQSPSIVAPVSLAVKPAVDMKVASSSIGNTVGNIALGRGTQAAATLQAGRGSLVYGSSSLANGLRSVVQFPGQPQAGLGVPGVGVGLPGYSSQPQFSFPNSEVTWIPILAGGGSSYSSPYIAVDGTPSAIYYTQQTTQASAFATSSGDANGSKTIIGSSFKAPSRPEADELGQQRRRYSQMTFGEERR